MDMDKIDDVKEDLISTENFSIFKTKTIEYRCCLIGILPFFFISDCIRCGICHFN